MFRFALETMGENSPRGREFVGLTSNVLPIAALILTFAWTCAYGRRAQQRGESLAAR
jgi:hypothetical protein